MCMVISMHRLGGKAESSLHELTLRESKRNMHSRVTAALSFSKLHLTLVRKAV